jgi:hypothetical protein
MNGHLLERYTMDTHSYLTVEWDRARNGRLSLGTPCMCVLRMQQSHPELRTITCQQMDNVELKFEQLT